MPDVNDLLEKTSRTFALTIPLLPEPTRQEVGLAYLLFRVADTFEDATLWTAAARVQALDELARVLSSRDEARAAALADRCRSAPPVGRADYVELLGELPFVLTRVRALRPAAQEVIRAHVLRTIAGMQEFLAEGRTRGPLSLQSIEELREYCYTVAGIVGEMLTELFVLERPRLAPLAPFLRERAAAFGEGLQLVNILKDAGADAQEGRRFLPEGQDLGAVFRMARQDLHRAEEYALALREAGAERGLFAFNALLVRLARATLTRVQEDGPGAKLSRLEVLGILAAVARESEADARPAV